MDIIINFILKIFCSMIILYDKSTAFGEIYFKPSKGAKIKNRYN